MSFFKIVNGIRYKLVYAKCIKRNGKYVYPRDAKAFRFWIKA